MKTLLTAAVGLALIAPTAPALTDDDAHASDRATVEWYDGSYNAAVREAKQRDTLVLVAFVPRWSEYATGLLEEVYPTPDVAGLMNEFVCVKFDDSEARESRQVQELFQVEDIPSMLFVGGNGRIEDAIFGYIPAEPLVRELDRILRGDDTVSARRAAAEAHQDDLALQYALAEKLGNCGDHRGAGQVMAAIRAADPQGETPTGAVIVLRDVWGSCQPVEGHERGLLDTSPVEAHLASMELTEVAFDGWTELGNYLANAGEPAAARAAFRGAWEAVRDEEREHDRGNWAFGVANYFVNAEDELSAQDVALAIELASVSVRSSRATCEAYAEESKARVKDGGEPGDWSEADQDAWVAERLDLLARAQFRHGDPGTRREALASARQAAELAPANEEYRARLASFTEEL